MKVGVFDSGIGGRSMALAIQRDLSDIDLLVREDRANLPYGNKTPEELLELVTPIMEEMVAAGCDIIVIACNTVTTTIIGPLRLACPVPLVAVEPMVKPAAEQSKTGVIAICATPTTLKSERYKWLKDAYASEVTVLEPDCSEWAFMIEEDKVDGAKIAMEISRALKQNADIIVLACTHYHWIEHEIRVLCEGRAHVIQPEKPVIKQLKRVIARLS